MKNILEAQNRDKYSIVLSLFHVVTIFLEQDKLNVSCMTRDTDALLFNIVYCVLSSHC